MSQGTAPRRTRLLRGLAERARSGDSGAREMLLFAYLDWVQAKARHLREGRPSADHDGLVRAGMQGLLHAIEDFHQNLWVSFRAYSYHRILCAMDADLRRQVGGPTTLDPARQSALRLVEEFHATARRRGMFPSSPDEVGSTLGWSPEEVRRALHAMKWNPAPAPRSRRPAGLPGMIQAAGHLRPVPDADLRSWREALKGVGDRERGVLEMRHGLAGEPPLSLRAAGERLGLSYEYVRVLEEKGLLQFRRRAYALGLMDGFWLEWA